MYTRSREAGTSHGWSETIKEANTAWGIYQDPQYASCGVGAKPAVGTNGI